jgi:hypothetical protein
MLAPLQSRMSAPLKKSNDCKKILLRTIECMKDTPCVKEEGKVRRAARRGVARRVLSLSRA